MAYSALLAFVALASLFDTRCWPDRPRLHQHPPRAMLNRPSQTVTPLSDIPVTYSDLPYQVFTSTYARGTQSGYNQCNSTTQTQNQNSECQTLIVNSIFDFCLYDPGTPNSTISDTEGEEVAWCTTKEHGTRGISPGTFTGLQVLQRNCATQTTFSLSDSSTKANVNIQPGDFGGELDGGGPGGQDGLGNPIGAEVFSTAFSTDNSTYEHTLQWNVFIGGNQVGIKVCNPLGSDPAGYCQNTLDRIGLIYNMPNQAVNGTFEVCDSDAMDIPGVHTSGGQTLSYSRPDYIDTIVPYPPVSQPARIVKHTRVPRFSPTLPHSLPLRPLPLQQAPEQAKIVVPVRAVLHLHLLLDPDLTAPDQLRYHSSRPSLEFALSFAFLA